jgi:hypothetical protein
MIEEQKSGEREEREEDEEQDTDVFEDNSVGELKTTLDADWIKLPRAELLTIPEADELLRCRHACVIAVIGERNGGKTTLITEIYERFLRGTFAGFCVAESRTLHGFERKSYPSRAGSGRIIPDTERTSKLEGLLFFHLSLVSKENGLREDLLFSERAGETYRDARDRPAESLTLVELQKAKAVAFILDGARVAEPKSRGEAFASVRNTIRGFGDAGAINTAAEIQLVTTKFDRLSENEGARTALEEFERRLIRSHEQRFRSMTIWRTAARDPSGRLEPAWGLAPLLRKWMAPVRSPEPGQVPLPPLYNEFDRLMLRRRQPS